MNLSGPYRSSEPRGELGIRSLRNLEHLLKVDRAVLRKLASEAQEQYSPFIQDKKQKPFQRPKVGGKRKTREIDNPSYDLKKIQRVILKSLLNPLRLPTYLHGAAKGKTIKTNAAAHLGKQLVVKMDIAGYYPNVTSDHIYRIWSEVLKCSPPVARLLTRLTTYNRHLPQGAPTSSALANIYLASIMPPIINACDWQQITPSAYVDDIMYSGENARALMEPTRKILAKEGLKFASKKREIMGPRDVKLTTGIRLGSKELRAPYEKLKHLRAGIHKLTLGIPLPGGRAKYLESLNAKLRHIESVCPKDCRKLKVQLASALTGPTQRMNRNECLA